MAKVRHPRRAIQGLIAGLDTQRFSGEAKARLAQEVQAFSDSIFAEAERSAEREGRPDAIGEKDVRRAAERLGSVASQNQVAVAGTIGGILAGGAFGNFLAFLSDSHIRPVAAIATGLLAAVGTGFLAYSFAKASK